MKINWKFSTPAILTASFGLFPFILGYGWQWLYFVLLGTLLPFITSESNERKDLSNVLREVGLVKKIDKDHIEAPKILWQRETESGYEAGLLLPVGLTSRDVQKRAQAIAEALDAAVEVKYKDGKTILNISNLKLKSYYDYVPEIYDNPLTIPIGYSRKQFETFTFSDGFAHLLQGGATGWGKSSFLRMVITYLILAGKVKLHLVDLKPHGVEFSMFRNCRNVENLATTPEETMRVLTKLENIVHERFAVFDQSGVVDIKTYNKWSETPLDYHIFIIDEYSNLMEYPAIQAKVDNLLKMCRATGVHGIICTQRPSADVLPGLIKAHLSATLAFHVRNQTNSMILLDRAGAEKLECEGRGILQAKYEVEVQVPYLSAERARELIKPYIIKKETPKPESRIETDGVISLEEWNSINRA